MAVKHTQTNKVHKGGVTGCCYNNTISTFIIKVKLELSMLKYS